MGRLGEGAEQTQIINHDWCERDNREAAAEYGKLETSRLLGRKTGKKRTKQERCWVEGREEQ